MCLGRAYGMLPRISSAEVDDFFLQFFDRFDFMFSTPSGAALEDFSFILAQFFSAIFYLFSEGFDSITFCLQISALKTVMQCEINGDRQSQIDSDPDVFIQLYIGILCKGI